MSHASIGVGALLPCSRKNHINKGSSTAAAARTQLVSKASKNVSKRTRVVRSWDTFLGSGRARLVFVLRLKDRLVDRCSQHGRGAGGELRVLRAGGGVHRRLHRRRAGLLRRAVAVRAVLGGRQVRGRQAVRGGGGRGGGRARAHGRLPHAQERRARRARRRRHAAVAAHRVREEADLDAERAPPRVGVVRRDLIIAAGTGSRDRLNGTSSVVVVLGY
jgi:hypothetical protein